MGGAAEKRHVDRWRLIYSLQVVDARTGASLGHVDDISMAGMKLVHTNPIERDRRYPVWLEVPLESGEVVKIGLDLQSCWTRVGGPDLRVSGFHSSTPSKTRCCSSAGSSKSCTARNPQ